MTGNSNPGSSQAMGNLQGQSVPGMSQGNLSGGQIVQSGISVNRNMMGGLRPSGVFSGTGMMIPTIGMTQQGQPGTQPLGANNNSAVSMALSQDSQQTSSASQSAQSKYIKVWEGNLSGQRQGQPVFITRLEGYRSFSAAENLAANWPPTLQIVRLIDEDHTNNKQYVGKADSLVFRVLNRNGFIDQLQQKKLCAVIQLPSQTLLLSATGEALRLTGMLFPGDIVVFKPQIPSQQQQLQPQMQSQLQQLQIQQQQTQQQLQQLQQQMQSQQHSQQQQLQQQQHQIQQQQQQLQQQQQQIQQLQQQQLQKLQQQQQQQLSQLQQQQQLTQMPQQLNQMPQQQQQPLHQLQQQQQLPQQQQMVGTGIGQSYIQGSGQSQLVSQGQVSSQGPPNNVSGGGFMS